MPCLNDDDVNQTASLTGDPVRISTMAPRMYHLSSREVDAVLNQTTLMVMVPPRAGGNGFTVFQPANLIDTSGLR
jgi:hypothetical protein